MNKMKIGSAVALPGKRGNGYLEIASYLDGTPVKTPVMILNGSKPGPRLWLQGCIHGNEYCGSLAILKVFREVAPEKMSGALIGFPALNFTAFLEERRFSTTSSKPSPRMRIASLISTVVTTPIPTGLFTTKTARRPRRNPKRSQRLSALT
jgi:hypothetical protein